MVNENEYYRPTMPNYQYYPEASYTPGYYYPMYAEQAYYYNPYMQNNSFPPHMQMMPTNVQPTTIDNPTQPQGVVSSGVMQQFMDENGTVDIQKMLQTVGQLADTVQQVSPVIKQLNDLIRAFRA